MNLKQAIMNLENKVRRMGSNVVEMLSLQLDESGEFKGVPAKIKLGKGMACSQHTISENNTIVNILAEHLNSPMPDRHEEDFKNKEIDHK